MAYEKMKNYNYMENAKNFGCQLGFKLVPFGMPLRSYSLDF